MKIIDLTQGTPEWIAARRGIPSASNFDMIVTTKGEPSKQRTKYLYKMAGERVSGLTEETYQNDAMKRGMVLESEARNLYEFLTGLTVNQVGFCVTEGDAVYGASPDGFVGDDGLLEIKCPTMAVHVGYLIDNVLPLDYYQQTQGQLLVTGRKWCDFLSYFPGIKPLLIRVMPDARFQESLKIELERFCSELTQIAERIKQ
jgi:putative phage-type endonuclease